MSKGAKVHPQTALEEVFAGAPKLSETMGVGGVVSPDAAKALQQVLDKAVEVAGDPERFASYEDDPIGFVEDVLGITLWEGQALVLLAAVEHKRIAVRSGHSVGKTFAVACLVLWWLYARKGLVITTAPTWDHVEGVLWREINAIASKARVPLPGTAYQTERRITNTWYALGLSTNMPSAFQGRHHPRLLVVLDEAPGVSEQVHLEVSTLATGEKNCILMIGNPTETSGTFYEAFKHPEVWKTFHISCLQHPNVISGEEQIKGAVTRFWVEDRQQYWGEEHPFWASRVLGEFPRISERGVIPLDWAERATNEEMRRAALDEAEKAHTPYIIGLDVARYGQNRCVMFLRRGDAVEQVESWHHASTMETAGRAMRWIMEYDPNAIIVDESGLGSGVVDRLLEQGASVQGYNSGHRAFTPGQFANRRSELWWLVRQRLEHQRLWYPNDPQLIADLVTPTYEVNSTGRIKIETKEALLDRGIKSPDFADALVMSFAMDAPEDFLEEVTLDKRQDPDILLENPLVVSDFNQLPYGF